MPFTCTVGFCGEIVNVEPGAEPVSATDCGLLVAVSVNRSVAERVPPAVGLKNTEVRQLPPATSVAPHEVLAMTKSPGLVPEIATLPIDTDDEVAFASITDCEELLEPTFVVAKTRLEGFGETLLGVTPRPVSATVCGLFVAESVNWSCAERFPVVVGAKTMLAVQLADAASEEPHVFE